ncbi:GNAT family N-acetyltransferase [Rhizobium leguminosarum]|uniref:GNAT family N-acetyltransferase n=1 Tax=Rhizobium leguminosarum TaxID=384 RepID=UPI001C97BF0D|nr:GNAT family N-acetyltransferase [Rhizobium leguminosarum]
MLPQSYLAQLQKIYVLRDFLAQRLGAPLLKASLERAASVRASAIWLAVLRENQRAIRFYLRHDFERLGLAPFTTGAQTFSREDAARRRICGVLKPPYLPDGVASTRAPQRGSPRWRACTRARIPSASDTPRRPHSGH